MSTSDRNSRKKVNYKNSGKNLTPAFKPLLACLLGQERKERENDCFSKTLFRKEKDTEKREHFRKKLYEYIVPKKTKKM
jgi:hypothetical protein